MTSIRNAENLTATTDTNGDILDYDVTNGGHWDVLGVLCNPDDAFNVVVRPWPGSAAWKYNFRVFKRLGDGTLVVNANTQVRLTFGALG